MDLPRDRADEPVIPGRDTGGAGGDHPRLAQRALAGPRALIALADNFDLPDHVKPLDVLAKALAALHELTPFIEETQKRVADNVVSPEDVGMIQRLAQKVNAALGETVLIAHRCAGMRAGGSR